MRYRSLAVAVLFVAASSASAQPGSSPSSSPPGGRPLSGGTEADSPEKKFEDFARITKGAKEYDGLFKLYQKDEHVYLEIQPHQFNKPLLAPIAISRGMGLGGTSLNFDEQWVLVFKRVGDKVHLVRRNVRFQSRRDLPVARAVETTYTDSVLMALPIKTINMARQGVLIDLNQVFFTDFAGLNLGYLDSGRTTWHKVKAFKNNVELQVAATFSGRGRGFGDNDAVIDPRGNTVVIQYGLMELPEFGYQPRVADDRVGHFIATVKDFTRDDRDSAFVRYVFRWKLERVDGSSWKEGGKLVPPKKKIVFWIERSVPDEYRAAVREGILEWNKAFEKVGFRDAIEVRQQESEDFDPEDANYNTFRWIANDQGYAEASPRANPVTGEILDADVIFDASMVRFYKQEQRIFRGPNGYFMDAPSIIQASRRGWLLPSLPARVGEAGWNDRAGPGAVSDPVLQAEEHLRAFRRGICQCASQKQSELGLALAAIAVREGLKPGDKVPDELIQQAVKETTMHEIGHALGLRHNFKASTMLKNEQLHDVALTRKEGLVASVMDYNPVNLAPKGVKQGDYFTTTLGPYDYWAIEYAYRPLTGGTEGEAADLRKIAERCAKPGYDYGTDEDLMTADPSTNKWDLGADPMRYAQDRMRLAEEVLKDMADHVVDKGDGYQRARTAFSLMLRQYGDAAFLVASHVGGEHFHRDHRGDPGGRDPLVPVKAARQREALRFLADHILTDRPFNFPPELLRKLSADRWLHWGNETSLIGGVEFPLGDRILRIQRIVLQELLDATTLQRVLNNASKADKDEQAVQIAEVFRTLTDAVFMDLPNGSEKPAAARSSPVRRNLQREYMKQLAKMVLGPKGSDGLVFFFGGSGAKAVPPDARSLARMHLRDVSKRIDLALADRKLDDTVRAHLEESKEQAVKILAAGLQVNEP